MEGGDRVPIGVFYVNPHTSTYEDRLAKVLKVYPKLNPSNSPIETLGKPVISAKAFEKVFEEFVVQVERAG